jgi:hypothetical protein
LFGPENSSRGVSPDLLDLVPSATARWCSTSQTELYKI